MLNGTDATPDVISARGLTKVFTDFWKRPKAKAVNAIDFDVRRGEIVGLLGPNGSGKSTTIKLVLGLLYPTSGVLRVFNESPRNVKTKARVGYLPEETYLYKYLTAFETLDFFGAMFNLDRASRHSRTEQLLEMVGLAHARDRRVGEFSKGMARRVGLAQAMINDPDLLVLDEPTSGLDPLGCKEVKDLIAFLKSRGKTILISSHLLADVEDICDRVIILYGGKIRATGALSDLLTVNNSTRVTAPSLSPEMTRKVLETLREAYAEEQIKVDKERLSLEEFFIRVVHEARSKRESTSGVDDTGAIAAYLRSGPAPSPVPSAPVGPMEAAMREANNVLPELLGERAREPELAPQPPPKPAPLPDVLKEPVPPAPAAGPSARDLAKDLREADGKLENILGSRE